MPGEGRDPHGTCQLIATSLSVAVVDDSGQPIPHMATKTVDLASGYVVHQSTAQNDGGLYTLVSDLDDWDPLPGERHELRFYAHSPQGTAMGDFVVRAGGCVCHVEALSGSGPLVLQPFPEQPPPEPTEQPPPRAPEATSWGG